ncbi:hypothetical protein PR202_gb17545 [Eleusine coracana subsp. coracana]|uniref:Uncharacterized protein n=1 Tax=Eleusine coracana subsp. coracana TaxID=191504 RepID=A0AAV5F2K6_ELECO|nr:hypothetical protein PR202_gb17545 [Eleusine coracana subsp. coracana]
MTAQGHLIPAVDTALLLATHGAVCSIVATPIAAARISATVASGVRSGLRRADREPPADARTVPDLRRVGLLPPLDLRARGESWRSAAHLPQHVRLLPPLPAQRRAVPRLRRRRGRQHARRRARVGEETGGRGDEGAGARVLP